MRTRVRSLLRKVTFPSVISAVLALNGLLNLVTGLAPVFKAASYLQLEKVPEYLRLSHGQRISGLMSILLGIVLIALARGLYERRRRSWGWALVVLVILMANNLYRGTTPQSSILSGALVVGLVLFRRRFNVPSERKIVYVQILAVASLLFALTYGIVGSYLMRAQFSGIKTWTDAVYFTFVTYSTLGYGDMLPQTDEAKLFAVSMVIVGLGAFITALAGVAGPMIEARMKGVLRIMSRFQHLTNHVIVCGYSNVSASVVDEIQERRVPYVIVEDRQDMVLFLQDKGHDVIAGDATKTETLERANLKKSLAIIAAFDSDSVNTLVALTANEYRKQAEGCRFRVLVRVEDEGNIEKVRHIGADEVISPSTMGGRLMAQKAMEAQGRTDSA